MSLMRRAENAIEDTKSTLNGAIVIALGALVLAAVAVVVALNRRV